MNNDKYSFSHAGGSPSASIFRGSSNAFTHLSRSRFMLQPRSNISWPPGAGSWVLQKKSLCPNSCTHLLTFGTIERTAPTIAFDYRSTLILNFLAGPGRIIVIPRLTRLFEANLVIEISLFLEQLSHRFSSHPNCPALASNCHAKLMASRASER